MKWIYNESQKIIDLVDKRNKELEEMRYGTSLDKKDEEQKPDEGFFSNIN